ncbi:branched-chain amino acid ABC transporter permease [Azospirillum brasilense]|uniref:Branched-chain amino acid ABC transporter permease n=1 Tax=Azospirillum brasilense TaxID=192 RepID=A0A0P0FB59_AZOBR|nr:MULTISPECIES: branched-chain amino acid ABC transporter permease [Azospirillum]ALJ36794.1 branched-chain amino acid ABC transporter [Azospirillum brasilense]MDW7555909.1 branched-chain amino acid ABC transporter permease [Azospirillum brasilense]MDW7595986.1 branched-chain amino acid ABC transporter permease [Azospirillum brasilense]MDW7630991.1 branched-chain amino acid ABC transporter permease [Azospirillum brasilense]MDX5951597.1 branched-chain amino acid ABC transporter permease [Azospi
MTGRGIVLLALCGALLLAAPMIADRYVLSVLTTVLWFAYVGQAWNVMMGFSGLLSLGHALYVGLGAYASAALFVHFGIGPWAGMWVAMLAATAAGCFIGFLGFRFGVRGVHFALLTIAFAEVARIGFDHLQWFGGSGGFFIPVAGDAGNDLLNLRGSPELFYYVILALVLAALALSRVLLHSRLGYQWLAVREEPEAAEAVGVDLFRARIAAVAVSSALTALGGVFQAFYFNNLFPEQVFSMGRSIEIILPAIVGGIGTLIGPILGAFILTPLGELLTFLIEATGFDLPGLKQLFYGVALVVIVVYRPDGVWPWLAARLGLVRRPGEDA